MIAKTFEIRDAATFIPVLAVKLAPGCEADRYLLARSGHGRTPDSQAQYVMIWRLSDQEGVLSPCDWNYPPRTMKVAHEWIQKNFDQLQSGEVVDVEFIIGLRPAPKISEREECPL